MKYLLVLLLLAVTNLTGRAGPAPLSTRLDLDASFDVTIGSNVENVYVTVAAWPDRARVALHIDEFNPACGRDGSCSGQLFAGDGRALVPPGDVVIARDLHWATIHTTVPFVVDISHLTMAVKIDLTMRAHGDFHRGDGGGNPGYFNATAMGVVATPLTTFVDTNVASASGTIARTTLW